MSVHYTSARTKTGRDDWATPARLVSAIARKLCVRFSLDTACESHNAIQGYRAAYCVDEGCDGLNADWALTLYRYGWHHTTAPDAAWCNPPYSNLRAWLRKASEEGKRCRVVSLIPARTDTRAWHESVMGSAHRVLLLKGRVKFVGAKASAPFPSAVVEWLPGSEGPPHFESWDWRAASLVS